MNPSSTWAFAFEHQHNAPTIDPIVISGVSSQSIGDNAGLTTGSEHGINLVRRSDNRKDANGVSFGNGIVFQQQLKSPIIRVGVDKWRNPGDVNPGGTLPAELGLKSIDAAIAFSIFDELTHTFTRSDSTGSLLTGHGEIAERYVKGNVPFSGFVSADFFHSDSEYLDVDLARTAGLLSAEAKIYISLGVFRFSTQTPLETVYSIHTW